MAEKLLMLALSPTMEEGTIVKWRKQVGDEIKTGDVVCDVETDKAVMEYEAMTEGTLLKTTVEEGGAVQVGDLIGVVGEEGEDISGLVDQGGEAPAPAVSEQDESAESTSEDEPEQQDQEQDQKDDQEEDAQPGEDKKKRDARDRVGARPKPVPPHAAETGAKRSSPLARLLADKHGLDWHTIEGSGPRGRVVKRDVEQVLQDMGGAQAPSGAGRVQAAAPGAEQTIDVSNKRKIIAQRLSESKFSAPHYYVKAHVAMDALLQARRQLNAKREQKVSLNSFIIKMVAQALRRHPMANATWNGATITQHGRVDIALAVAQDDGLITPVVRNCADKGILAIDDELRQLIDKARAGKLDAGEYTNSTFTISNLGMFEIDEFTAIINPPNSAILALGQIAKQLVLDDDDEPTVRSMMTMTLSCDHRVLDGAVAAAFVRDLKHMLAEPIHALL